jgi:hypothetical protein
MKTVNTEFKRMQKKQSFSDLKQMHGACFSSQILIELEFTRQTFRKHSETKFCENPPVEANLFHADRWMDRQDEAFHNIADVPNKRLYIKRIILQRKGISLCHIKRRS